MSKYDELWKFLKESGRDEIKLSFDEIEKISGCALDHSFLTYKKEAEKYGYITGKISMKEKTVKFNKN